MKKITILTLLVLTLACNSDRYLETYTSEISELKTEEEKATYWKLLEHLDQVTYLEETKNVVSGDSISIMNMIRTALMFEVHGTTIYKPNNTVPILNLSHNYYGDSNLAFWPIIQKCKTVGGIIESFGGKFPKYQLEGIALTFYDYSLLANNSEYSQLLKKLNDKTYPKVSTELAKIHKKQMDLIQLEELNLVGTWKRQHIKNNDDMGTFELVSMSDNNLYLRRKHRLHQLITISEDEQTTTYKIENEPFGWMYKLSQGKLSLIDDLNNTLITYNSVE